jgi:peptidoglycan/LPS O-acetylase OafA/YrhL
MTVSSKTYFKELDATRFLGFLHVFLAHCFVTSNPVIEQSSAFKFVNYYLKAGFLGLDYFFVISSFLLTYLALEERNFTGNFKPINFLIRRGLRLWPLYFLIVFGVYSIVEILPIDGNMNALPPLIYFLFFIQNFWMVNHGQNFLFLLVFLWSIAVEEQFYLFWAIVQKFFSAKITFISICLIAVSVAFRYWYFYSENHLLFHTFSVFGNFGLGAICAKAAFENWKVLQYIKTMRKSSIFLTYSCLTLSTFFYFTLFKNRIPVSLEKIYFGLFFCFVILEQSYAQNSFIKLGFSKIINYLGQLSLGLYVYHGIVLTLFFYFFKDTDYSFHSYQVFMLNPFFILLCTIVISVVSYELFEKRIYRLRKRF